MAENDESHPPAEAEGGKKEEKQTGPLENIVKEGWDFLKKGLMIGAAAGMPFIYSIPGIPFGGSEMVKNTLVTSLPLSAGAMLDNIMAKKPVDYKKALRESVAGTLMTPPLTSLLGGINTGREYAARNYGKFAGNATAVASLAAGQTAFVGAYTGLDHVLSKYSLRGLYERFKKDYWPTLKRMWMYVLPFSMWNVLYIYKFGMFAQLAYGSLTTLLFRLVGPKSEGAKLGNLFTAMNPFPIISSAYSLGVKAVKNTFSSAYKGTYGLGAAISSLFTSLTSTSGPAAPKTAEPKPAEGEQAPAHHYMKAPSEK